MRTFNDNAGRTWTVAINTDSIRDVRKTLQTDLLECLEGGLIAKLIRDPVLLCDVIYVVCKPQADRLGISDTDFGRAMAGDAIDQATQALLGGLVDFCPSPRDRANLKGVIDRAGQAMDLARDAIEQRIEKIDVTAIVREALEACGERSTSSQASSA